MNQQQREASLRTVLRQLMYDYNMPEILRELAVLCGNEADTAYREQRDDDGATFLNIARDLRSTAHYAEI